MTFEELGLSEHILKAVKAKGYTKPSPIQEKAIPHILDGKDVLASAQTGTGKTAGFTLPILENLAATKKEGRRPIRSLILTPTRELAAQVYENVREYSEHLDIKCAVIFGGVKAKAQITTLRRGVDVLVATPGRLLDLESQGALSLRRVKIFVLDEADRMLDMGFLRDIKKVISLMPSERQNLLFSATFSKDIKALAHTFLNNPVSVEATPENTATETITQKVYSVDKGKKTEVLINLIKDGNWSQVLIFTRTKHGANKLTQKLEKAKITAAAIHGNKSQGARTRALANFKDNSIRVLVATDIAARGLDIPLLPHVINYELPNVPEDYVHRIGRTGRAGAKGEAISLVCSEEMDYKKAIEKVLNQRLETAVISGYEPTDTAPPKKAASQKNKKKYSDNNGNRSAKPKRQRPSNKDQGGRNSGNRRR
ncbi:DEAD/DEAH box helicase [Aurantibacter sp.]|uniref:DEAD/DEAH box helicase n=1 Tax=Aurantibacter sp. TaxID=2807103 RepID=UPI0035C7B568